MTEIIAQAEALKYPFPPQLISTPMITDIPLFVAPIQLPRFFTHDIYHESFDRCYFTVAHYESDHVVLIQTYQVQHPHPKDFEQTLKCVFVNSINLCEKKWNKEEWDSFFESIPEKENFFVCSVSRNLMGSEYRKIHADDFLSMFKNKKYELSNEPYYIKEPLRWKVIPLIIK